MPFAPTGQMRALTAKQAERLRQSAHDGVSQVNLAQEYKISEQLVSHIIRGRRYPDAGGPVRTVDPETGGIKWTSQ